MAAIIASALVFTACESTDLTVRPELELLSIKIGDLEVRAIPIPVSGGDWDNEEYDVADADIGRVVVKTTGTENKRVSAAYQPADAVVTWGREKGSVRPPRFNDLRMPLDFDEDSTDFLYFKLADPESGETKYYCFAPVDASPVKELADLAIAGRRASGVPIENGTMDALALNISRNAYRGQVDITRTEATRGAVIAATPQDQTARIRYAKAEDLAAAQRGEFTDFVGTARVVVQDEQGKNIPQDHGVLTFGDGNILAVEVAAENDNKNFYGFMVTAGHMAIISKLTFNGVEAVGKGIEKTAWTDVVAGSFDSADQGPGGFNIGIVLEDGEGSAEWGLMTAVNAAQNTVTFTPGLTGTQLFSDKQALAIRVKSYWENSPDTRYYKVQINLLAANFRKHPKSAAYEIVSHTYEPANAPGQEYNGRILINATGNRVLDRAIEPLTFELDRSLAGGTYQWYTANSWYGGYGFDKEGRIAFDLNVSADGYHVASNYDEKGNISFHNGGNQYYRLSYPGNPISGATGTVTGTGTTVSYTPTIGAGNRPFITGFSNQTQYYWVEVTDSTGLKAVSDRAAIVTEWGVEFEKGIPKVLIDEETEEPVLDGDGNPVLATVLKKHHIVDMHAYMDPTAYGLKGNPRNAAPFKAGNHGDKYLIPITFPDGFDITEYSMVTCQAKFFLADGKEWIQNWTQGDFGFANAAEENIVLWYNLTNDNATKGLSNSGSEGSSLNEIPAFLIVQPAGTKPINELPPFQGTDAWGRPQPVNNNNAQGWFTPYIEIVELRFEGPSRVCAVCNGARANCICGSGTGCECDECE
jgi:hypothetical protein